MAEKVLRTLAEQVAPGHTALIIVDPQEDFVGNGGYGVVGLGWDVSRMQAALRRLNELIPKARQAGVMVVWIRTNYASEMLTPNVKASWWHMTGGGQASAEDRPRSTLVKEGTEGARWWSEMIEPLPDEYVITKWHFDAFEDTSLDLLLKSTGIKTVIMSGVQTNACVETAIRHAFTKGYYVVLVSDCTDTTSQQEYDATILNVRNRFALVASSSEVSQAW
ncbi:MAG: cysteine hydrolase [Chloroflexota bacterium]|nr:MAG: cysteine hydrolase [Chloroflexota bacterium]